MISHLCIDLKDQYDYIAFAGTRLSLAEVEFTQCATGRQDPLNIFNEFPYYNGKSSIMQQFKCLVDMTDCDLSDESVSMLAGRPHILNYAIQLLEDSPSKLKTEVLEKAITDSYMSIRKFIVRSCTKQILMYRNPKAVVYWLFKFAITRAVDPKFVLATSKGQLFDFVHAGIFHLKFFKYSLFAVPSERLGLDVVYNLLEAFSAILPRDSLAYQVLQIDDATKARHVAQKGGFMETIIAECLLSEGRMDKLQTLAVTDHKEDMSWIKDFQFKEYGYATDLGVKNMENYHSEDFALLKEFVGGPRDAVLLRPKQNLGPNLLGLKKMMENGVLCKRIMWVSSKILQHYDDQIEDEPRKDVQKKFKEEIVPQLDLDRVLIVHVLHPEGNSDQRFTRSELEPGQVLINITLDNIQYLIEDAMVVSVIKEINNAEEVATEGAEKIFDANVVNDEEMTESNMKSNRQVKIRIMKTECKNSSCLTLLVDIGENTDHKERVKLWLLQSKLERFYEVFIEHGFDSLRQLIVSFVVCINTIIETRTYR
jgi:acid stress-induced BolA-like protein IbaG/YrbA